MTFDPHQNNSTSSNLHKDNNDETVVEDYPLFQTAVDALLSPLHQATTKEELTHSAARRTQTVQDMRYYWNKIVNYHQDQCANESTTTPTITTTTSILPYQQRLIHITGTKGKGSTACMCEAVLRKHGYSTGLFTSPHLIDIRERIRWNGRPIHKSIFARVYWNIRKALEVEASEDHANRDEHHQCSPPPTLPGYFRMLTLMGLYTFLYELQSSVDVIILEVGMGGRYDATNFINTHDFQQPQQQQQVVCGVTLLDFDHVRILGDTLEKIAWEKGGIFATDKASTTAVSKRPSDKKNDGDNDDDVNNPTTTVDFNTNNNIHHAEAKKRRMELTTTTTNGTCTSSSSLLSYNREFYILDSNTPGVINMMESCASIEGSGGTLHMVDATGRTLQKALEGRSLGLAGQHQYGNATLAVTLCKAITVRGTNDGSSEQEPITFESPTTIDALVTACWPGRCQTYQPPNDPRYIFYLDGAHTAQSMEATMQWFQAKMKGTYHSDVDNNKIMNSKGRPTDLPILVFNCSHERNPIDLLNLILSIDARRAPPETTRTSPISTAFSRVFFATSDSTRPSPVSLPSARQLLEEKGIVTDDEKTKQDNQVPTAPLPLSTWQDTLKCIYKHLHSHHQSMRADDDCHRHCRANLSAKEILQILEKEADRPLSHPTPVLVTGSLYLVGSFLNALKWKEESSPPAP